MARRRRRRSYRRARTARPVARKRRRSRSSGGVGKQIIAAAGYGVARGYVSAALQRYVPSVVGAVGDEAAMLATTWAVSKYGPSMLKPAAKAGMIVEAASLGRTLASRFIGSGSAASNGGVF
jgi:hypothetical protein